MGQEKPWPKGSLELKRTLGPESSRDPKLWAEAFPKARLFMLPSAYLKNKSLPEKGTYCHIVQSIKHKYTNIRSKFQWNLFCVLKV